MSSYAALVAEHASLPSFTPLIATSSLQSLAYTFLTIAFFLSFYFSTLGKESSKREFVVGGAASVAGGLGLVLAFCAVGVNV